MRMFYNTEGGFQSIGYTASGQVVTLDNRARLSSWDLAVGRPQRLLAVPISYGWAVLKCCRSEQQHIGILTSSGFHRYDLITQSELPLGLMTEGRIAEASDDGTLVVVNERGSLRWRLWSLETKQPLADAYDLPGDPPMLFRYNPVLAPNNEVFSMSVVGDGRVLLWLRGEQKPRVLARSGRGYHYPFLAFSPDARLLVGAQTTQNGRITVWSLPSGAVLWSQPQEVFVWAIAVHPSGQFLATATAGGPAGRTVRFLESATGTEIRRFNWNAGKIRCLAFSPDGLTCVAGFSDRRLIIWDVDL